MVVYVDVGPPPKEDLSAELTAARTALLGVMRAKDRRGMDTHDWQLLRRTFEELAACVHRLEKWEEERLAEPGNHGAERPGREPA